MCSDVFVTNIFCVAAPFNKKLQKGQPKSFDGLSDKEITALETLKWKLIEPLVLAPPRTKGDYTVETDTQDGQTGCNYYRSYRMELMIN